MFHWYMGIKNEVEMDMENFEKYQQFRLQYPKFIYHGYEIGEEEEQICIQYHFEIPGLSDFTPSWKFPKGNYEGNTLEQLKNNSIMQKLVFSLGMVELISYWKITCSKEVEVLCANLQEKEIRWWKELYFYGLGEFFYTNGIPLDKEGFMELYGAGNSIVIQDSAQRPLEGCLVPVGGGKDSVVSLELLKKAGEKIKCYIINPRGATVNCVEAGGYGMENTLVANRTLDRRMIELNQQGYLNGHTPYSAIVAFSSTITAFLHGIKYICLSNEASANESTVMGSTVNHQYSKSFKFEKDFHTYEKKFIGSGTYYFSLLRPLSEFQIARYFSGCTAYHPIFRSCNAGSKEDKWCGHCPKCLFVFFILSPFLSHERLCEIFKTDMLEDETMEPVMRQLIGEVEEKPFECVGSREEVNTAICMTIADMEKQGAVLPKLLATYKTTAQYSIYSQKENTFFSSYEEENLLPEKFEKLIKENCF